MKKILCLGVAAVMAFACFAMSGCGDKDVEETTTAETTTEAPTTTEATTTTKAVTYKTIYKSQLDSMIDQYGAGVTGGKLIDMDNDGTPEMIVIHDMTVCIYTIRDEKASSLYEGTAGLRYGQTDASYEVLINESCTPTVLVLFNATDEWVDENITAVSIFDGEATTEELKAATNGENDTPAREELETFSINGSDVTSTEYNTEYERLTVGADVIDPRNADLEGLRSALEE